jgi:hypothetical protein
VHLQVYGDEIQSIFDGYGCPLAWRFGEELLDVQLFGAALRLPQIIGNPLLLAVCWGDYKGGFSEVF